MLWLHGQHLSRCKYLQGQERPENLLICNLPAPCVLGHRPVPLQVKEEASMHSEGLLAGKMKHGPLALVDEQLPIIVLATRNRIYAKMRSVMQQLLARGARLITVCNDGDSDTEETCASRHCHLIRVTIMHLLSEVCLFTWPTCAILPSCGTNRGERV